MWSHLLHIGTNQLDTTSDKCQQKETQHSGLTIMASHRTFSSQTKHMSGQIKVGQTNLLFNINENFIEFVKNNECPEKFWSFHIVLNTVQYRPIARGVR